MFESQRTEKVPDRNEGSVVFCRKEKSHLAEGVKPIVACVGTYNEFIKSGQLDEKLPDLMNLVQYDKGVDVVVWGQKEEVLREKKMLGTISYTISGINERKKLSRSYYECTALTVAGKDSETGADISFLTHQAPYFVLERDNTRFLRDLRKRLLEMNERCERNTIDAIITGGDVGGSKDGDTNDECRKRYVKIVALLSKEVKRELGFDPMVAAGPKMGTSHGDHIVYDTRKRRMYIVRPNEDGMLESGSVSKSSFRAGEVSEQSFSSEDSI